MNNKKILVVDDDAVILKTLSIKLKSHGYDVLTATDGSEAVSIVRHQKPDLILLDISFPPDVAHGGGVGWDGFLILEWLHRMDEGMHVPIILITGGDPVKLKERSMKAGAVALFHKPIVHDELLTLISKTLGEDTAPSQAPA
jgi:CheY-like chemotaxis protein